MVYIFTKDWEMRSSSTKLSGCLLKERAEKDYFNLYRSISTLLVSAIIYLNFVGVEIDQ